MTCFEEWRPVPGFPRYEASSLGRVRKTGSGQQITISRSGNGHWFVRLNQEDGKRKAVAIGWVVLTAFGFVPASGEIALHGPAGRDVHSLDNLSFGTYAQNNGTDRLRDGTDFRGCKSPVSKLTQDQVNEIIALKGKVSGPRLGNKFGVSSTTIYRIHSGKRHQ
jgi:hypothetical protein